MREALPEICLREKGADMSRYRFLASLAVAITWLVPMGVAQNAERYNPLPRHFPTKERFVHEFAGGGGGSNLSYHGGPVLTTAYVVPIFWGPTWSSGGSDNGIAGSLSLYIDGNGTTGVPGYGETHEYNVITQYYESGPLYILQSNLGALGGALYDSSTPPTNVTDADVQAEVVKMTNKSPRTDTVYEVFLPASSYSSDGSYTSCGGPQLYYCAYHGNFSYSGLDVKYASMPYPSCGGCQGSGFTTTQNFEHFISHETREAVTDENGTAWYDRRGYEADDKCAWSPTPFTDSKTGTNADGSAFAYQYEWSNANSGCVKTR
jgi:hypothetical protein